MKKAEIVDEIHKLAPNMTVGSANVLMKLRKNDLEILLKRLDTSRIEMGRVSRRLEVDDKEQKSDLIEGDHIIRFSEKNPLCSICEYGPRPGNCWRGTNRQIPIADHGVMGCSGFTAKIEETQKELKCFIKEADNK